MITLFSKCAKERKKKWKNWRWINNQFGISCQNQPTPYMSWKFSLVMTELIRSAIKQLDSMTIMAIVNNNRFSSPRRDNHWTRKKKVVIKSEKRRKTNLILDYEHRRSYSSYRFSHFFCSLLLFLSFLDILTEHLMWLFNIAQHGKLFTAWHRSEPSEFLLTISFAFNPSTEEKKVSKSELLSI